MVDTEGADYLLSASIAPCLFSLWMHQIVNDDVDGKRGKSGNLLCHHICAYVIGLYRLSSHSSRGHGACDGVCGACGDHDDHGHDGDGHDSHGHRRHLRTSFVLPVRASSQLMRVPLLVLLGPVRPFCQMCLLTLKRLAL
jgi:hypothetical protein